MSVHRLSFGFSGLALVVMGAIACGLAMAEMTWPDAEAKLLDGKWASAFEDAFDDAFPLKDAAVGFWARVEYALFEEGRPGVLVGAEGTLFTDEEFRVQPDEARELAWKAALIADIHDFLSHRGIRLVVALVPAKARIERELLGRHTLPPRVEARYETFLEALALAGVMAPDLREPLRQAREQAPVFLSQDTHWTPHGARAVANAIGKVTGAVGSTHWRVEQAEPVSHSGDLVRFLPLGDAAKDLGFGDERVVPFTTSAEGGGGLGLFDELSLPVTVIGTSYTAIETWNFAGALRVATGADVLNASKEGLGPVRPMLDYLVNEAFTETPPDLIVWEMPERFLPVTYPLQDHPALALLQKRAEQQ